MPSSDSDSDSSSDGVPEIGLEALSADTLAALKAHKAAKAATSKHAEGGLVSEDFGLSQFWYDEQTQQELAQELLDHGGSGPIAIISAPSVMNGMMALPQGRERSRVHIFEFDQRFCKAYPASFVQYDYNAPLDVPEHLRGACDYVLADPPYLNEPCVAAFFESMQLLARKPWTGTPDAEVTPMMFVTSPRNHAQLLRDMGMRRTPYQLHFQSKFATPIGVFVNYRSPRLGGFVQEEPDDDAQPDHSATPAPSEAATPPQPPQATS